MATLSSRNGLHRAVLSHDLLPGKFFRRLVAWRARKQRSRTQQNTKNCSQVARTAQMVFNSDSREPWEHSGAGLESKAHSIDAVASGQLFSSNPRFSENARHFRTAPDQEIQLPECETYLIVIVDASENALEFVPTKMGDCIDAFAPGQLFRVLLVLQPAFPIVSAYVLGVGIAELGRP